MLLLLSSVYSLSSLNNLWLFLVCFVDGPFFENPHHLKIALYELATSVFCC